MNGSIIIFRAGKITLAEKVSSVFPKAWPDLATGSYASYSLRHRSMSFFMSVELNVHRIVPAGLVLLVCTKAPHAGLDTEAEQSLSPLKVPFSLTFSSLLEQPGLWSGGAGRQRETAWELQDAELANISR